MKKLFFTKLIFVSVGVLFFIFLPDSTRASVGICPLGAPACISFTTGVSGINLNLPEFSGGGGAPGYRLLLRSAVVELKGTTTLKMPDPDNTNRFYITESLTFIGGFTYVDPAQNFVCSTLIDGIRANYIDFYKNDDYNGSTIRNSNCQSVNPSLAPVTNLASFFKNDANWDITYFLHDRVTGDVISTATDSLVIKRAKPRIYNVSPANNTIISTPSFNVTFSADNTTDNGGGKSSREMLFFRYKIDESYTETSTDWLESSKGSKWQGIPGVDGINVDSVFGFSFPVDISSLTDGIHTLYLQVANGYLKSGAYGFAPDIYNNAIYPITFNKSSGGTPTPSGGTPTPTGGGGSCSNGPTVTMNAVPSSVNINQGFSVSWSSTKADKVTNSSFPCLQSNLWPFASEINGSRGISCNSGGGMNYSITVAKSDDTCPATASATVNVGSGPGTSICNPTEQSVDLNQNVSLFKTGSATSYTWSAPGGNPSSGPALETFTTKYSTSGKKQVALSNGTSSSFCTVNVSDTAENNAFPVQTSIGPFDINQLTTYNEVMQNSGNTTWTKESIWEGEDANPDGPVSTVNDAQAFNGKARVLDWTSPVMDESGDWSGGAGSLSTSITNIPAGKHIVRFYIKSISGGGSSGLGVVKIRVFSDADVLITEKIITKGELAGGGGNYVPLDLVFTNSGPVYFSAINLTNSSTGIVPVTVDRIWMLPYQLGFDYITDDINNIWKASIRIDIPGTNIPPNVQASFPVSLTTPSIPGFYYLKWKMRNELREWFGQQSSRTVAIYNKPVSPANSEANVAEDPSFSWTKGQCNNTSGGTKLGPNVKGYLIELTEDPAFSWHWRFKVDNCNTTNVNWGSINWDTAVSGGRAAPAVLIKGKTYYWRVNMYDDQSDGAPGNNADSPVNIFFTGATPSGPPSPSPVTVTQPNFCLSSSSTVSWTYSDPNNLPQSAYQVLLDDHRGLAFSPPIYDSGKINCVNCRAYVIPSPWFNELLQAQVIVWNSINLSGEGGSNDWRTPNHAFPSTSVSGFTWSPQNPPAKQNVNFTDKTTCYKNDGSPDVCKNWAWNFGDGGTSTIQNPTYKYSQKGTYNISETVTDKDNNSCSATSAINVAEPVPEFKEIPPGN